MLLSSNSATFEPQSMTTKKSNLDHTFSAIRREVSDELSALTVMFAINDEGNVDEAMRAQAAEIKQHPAGGLLLSQPRPRQDNTELFHISGPAIETSKLFMNFGIKQEYLFLGVFSKYSFAFYEDESFAAQYLSYACVFKAMHAYFMETGKIKGGEEQEEATPLDAQQQRIQNLRMNLMADAFAAMMMESKGIKGAIQRLIKRYCELSVKATINMFPEYHPLPMAIDGLNVVYKDLKDDRPPKVGELEHTFMMALEIGQTYDDLSLQQWTRFCLGTQDMVWADFSANEILSAAIYGSDDPYIRSNAYICAESLNTNPVPLKNNDLYNPFSDDDKNDRAHMRLCRTAFIKNIEVVNHSDNSQIFLDRAVEQTKKLLAGHPIGWCAPALMEAENAYRLFRENPKAEEDIIQNAFHGTCAKIKWFDLKRFNRFIIAQKRRGVSLTLLDVINLVDQNSAYAHYRPAFELIAQYENAKTKKAQGDEAPSPPENVEEAET